MESETNELRTLTSALLFSKKQTLTNVPRKHAA